MSTERMKMKELRHYHIGESYGGNQEWFTDFWMNIGGCGAVTACECCIYLAGNRGMPSLYPFDAAAVTKEDFTAFAMRMKPYLSPRPGGIDRTATFIEGFERYIAENATVRLRMTSLEGDAPFEAASAAIRDRIDGGFPVPYLMLKHRNKALEDFCWHWFLLNAYDEAEDTLQVRAVTYGEAVWLDLAELWNTGYTKKGGIVLLSEANEDRVTLDLEG